VIRNISFKVSQASRDANGFEGVDTIAEGSVSSRTSSCLGVDVRLKGRVSTCAAGSLGGHGSNTSGLFSGDIATERNDVAFGCGNTARKSGRGSLNRVNAATESGVCVGAVGDFRSQSGVIGEDIASECAVVSRINRIDKSNDLSEGVFVGVSGIKDRVNAVFLGRDFAVECRVSIGASGCFCANCGDTSGLFGRDVGSEIAFSGGCASDFSIQIANDCIISSNANSLFCVNCAINIALEGEQMLTANCKNSTSSSDEEGFVCRVKSRSRRTADSKKSWRSSRRMRFLSIRRKLQSLKHWFRTLLQQRKLTTTKHSLIKRTRRKLNWSQTYQRRSQTFAASWTSMILRAIPISRSNTLSQSSKATTQHGSISW